MGAFLVISLFSCTFAKFFYMEQTKEKGQGVRRAVDTTRHHRENGWDYRGRAVYHFTFPVEGRFPLFGTLEGESAERAFIKLNPFGYRVYQILCGLPQFYAAKGFALKVLAQKVMPDHIHLVIQVLEPLPQSIGAVVRGFKSACTKVYKQEFLSCGENAAEVHSIANQQENAAEMHSRGGQQGNAAEVHSIASQQGNAAEMHSRGEQQGDAAEMHSIASQQGNAAEMHGRASQQGNAAEVHSIANRQGDAAEMHGRGEQQGNAAEVHGKASQQGNAAEVHGIANQQGNAAALMHFARIFANRNSIWQQDAAYYHERILHAPGQLHRMINYVKDNPRRLWLKKNNPDLFRLHRHTDVCGLSFTSLGNHFLLDWHDNQTVEMSRNATVEQIQIRLQLAMAAAQNGAVTYTAAISKGEQLIARTLRKQGYPLVVLLSDGFPKEGSPHERFYKPGGIYFEACSRGQLLLLEPTEQTFLNADIQSAVEETLRRKAAERHYSYEQIPLKSQRYRFVALNEIAKRLARIER